MAKKLFIPGPVDVSSDVAAKMSEPMIGHRSEAFKTLYMDTLAKLKQLMYTQNTVIIAPSSSTGLMEAAVRNCVKERCLNVINGAFSQRWHDITISNGKKAEKLEVEWGSAATPEIVEEKLKTNEYDAMTIVHNESSTGVATPLDGIAKVAKKYDVSLLVDTVSSLAGMKIEVDKLGLDVCLAGVQKCFAVAPGITVCSISNKALEKAKTIEDRGYYFDFLIYTKSLEKSQTPTTPAIPQIKALNYQLDKILNKEGLEHRFKRHREMADITRKWAKKNFAMLPEDKFCSDTVSCIMNTRNLNLEEIKKKLSDTGYVFANGYGKLKDITFRIAHMGDRTVDELKEYIEAIDGLIGC